MSNESLGAGAVPPSTSPPSPQSPVQPLTPAVSPPPPPPVYDRLLVLRNTQSLILQGYRNIFLTSQSILLAAAVFATNRAKEETAFFPWSFVPAVLPIFALYLLRLWKRATRRRGDDELYLHWHLRLLENNPTLPLKVMEQYDTWRDKKTREQERARMEKDPIGGVLLNTDRPTRTSLDRTLPFVFGIIWVVFFLLILYSSRAKTFF